MFPFGSRASRNTAATGPEAGGQAPSVDALRRQARQRLIGATVLVVAALVLLPWLLEAQPRPVPVDVTIDIPAREPATPLPAPVLPAASNQESEQPATSPTPAGAQTVVNAPPVVQPPAAEPSSAASPPPAVAAPPKQAPATPAPAPAAPAPERPSDAATEAAKVRIVVQVGAYADPARAQEVRKRLESAGLKTYTHVADTPQGKRIRVRVGPFESRAEADKVAAKVKSLGLPAAVLTL